MENITKFEDNKLKVFMDTEFTGLHQNTTLISIGLISETGDYFYAESGDYDYKQIDEWIENNVINNLLYNDENKKAVMKTVHTDVSFYDKISSHLVKGYNCLMKSSFAIIGHELNKWLHRESLLTNKQIQIYSDCLSYDWVLFNQLICEDGEALNIPEWIYYIPYDLSTALQVNGIDPDINREEFAGEEFTSIIKKSDVFNGIKDPKHNSLWDACVIGGCWKNLNSIYIA